METQLSKQLRQLHTDKVRTKARPSFLFTAREAAEYDTATIHGIGQNGLAELIQIDSNLFASFQKDLFSDAWASIDRETSSQAVADSINVRIGAFARAVCPYLQLRAAHKCLEWLVRRFKAQVYNIDALLEAALPQSESIVFGRLIQLLELGGSREALGPGSASVGLWHFLLPNQQSGAPMPREVLARQCLKDPGVLRFVCDLALKCAAAANAGQCNADTALAWWAVVCTETIMRAPTVTDALLSTLLGPIVDGAKDTQLRSRQCAAYAVAASALSGSRASVTRKLFTGLIGVIASGVDKSNPRHALSAVIAIFAGQAHHQEVVDVGSLGPGELSLTDAGAWLRAYRLEPSTLSAILAMHGAAEVVGSIAQVRSSTPFVSCLVHTAVSAIPKLAEDDRASAEATSRLCRQLMLQVPTHTIGPLATMLTRSILAALLVGRESQTACSLLTGILRTLSEVAGLGVEQGLRDVVGVETMAKPLQWATQALEGGESGPLAAGAIVYSGTSALSAGLSIRLALEHPLSLIREKAVEKIRCQAEQVVAARVAGSDALHITSNADADAITDDVHEGSSSWSLSASLRNIARALQRSLEDDDPYVVDAALRVHSYLAVEGVVAVILPADGSEEECASATLRRNAEFVRILLAVVRRWLPVAMVRIEQVMALAAGSKAVAGAGASAEDQQIAASGEPGNRRARREQTQLLKQLASVNPAPPTAAESASNVDPAVIARLRSVLGARSVINVCLEIMSGPVAVVLCKVATNAADSACTLQCARLLTAGLLSMLPIGEEQLPTHLTGAILPEGALPRGRNLPYHPFARALLAATDLGSKSASLFSLFKLLGSAGIELNTSARLAAALLSAALESTAAHAACLKPIIDAASCKPDQPSMPHPARAKLGAICLLDTAVAFASGELVGATDACALALRAAIPQLAVKPKGSRAVVSINKDLLGSAVLAMCNAAAACLRDDWMRCCLALGKAADLRREKERAKDTGGKVRRPSTSADVVGVDGVPGGDAVAARLCDVPHAGMETDTSLTIGALRKVLADADDEPTGDLTVLLHASAVDDKVRHELNRRAGKLRARLQLVGAALQRILLASMAPVAQQADAAAGLPDPADIISDPSLASRAKVSQRLSVHSLVMLLGTRSDTVDWDSLGPLVQTALAGACMSNVVGQDNFRRVNFLADFASKFDILGDLTASRALTVLRKEVNAMPAGSLEKYTLPTLFALATAETQNVAQGAVRNEALLALRESIGATPSSQSAWVRAAQALTSVAFPLHGDAALARKAVAAYAVSAGAASATELISTFMLPAMRVLIARSGASAIAGHLAVLIHAIVSACHENRVTISGLELVIADLIKLSITTIAYSKRARPGLINALLLLIQLAPVAAGRSQSSDDIAAVCGALQAALLLPAGIFAVPDGLSLGVDARTAGLQDVSGHVLAAAAQAVTPALWSAAGQKYKQANASQTAAGKPRSASKTLSNTAGQSFVMADLFSALLVAAGHGHAGTASSVRGALAQLSLPSDILLEYLDRADLLPVVAQDTETASTVSPTFSNSGSVAGVLRKWISGHGAQAAGRVVKRMSQLSLFCEVISTSLGDHKAGKVVNSTLMLERLWIGLATVCAIPAALQSLSPPADNDTEMVSAVTVSHEPSEADLASGSEYTLQLLLTCTSLCLNADDAATTAKVLDADLPVHIAQTCTSAQTLTAALETCAMLARHAPVQVLRRLLPLLGHVAQASGAKAPVTNDAGPGGWTAVLRVVTAILPSLRTSGPALGLTPHALLAVFTGVLPSVSIHRRRGLYSSFLHAMASGWSSSAGSATGGRAPQQSHPLGPLAVLMMARAVSTAREGQMDAARAINDDTRRSDVAPASRAELVGDAGPGFTASLSQGDMGDPASLGAVPELVAGLLSSYSVPQQVTALAHIVAVAYHLLSPVASASASKLITAVSRGAPMDFPAASSGQKDEDVAAVLPSLLIGGQFSGQEALVNSSTAQASTMLAVDRLSLALGLVRLVAAHVGTREFVSAAVAAASQAAKKDSDSNGKDKNSGATRLQRAYLALSERLFDTMQVAALGRSACSGSGLPNVVSAPVARIWTRVEDAACSLLERLSAVLAPAAFVAVVGALLHHDHEGVRTRALSFLSDFLRDAYGPLPGPVPDADTRLYVTLLPDMAETLIASASGTILALTRVRVSIEAAALMAEYLSTQPAPGSFPETAAANPDVTPLTVASRASAFKPILSALHACLPKQYAVLCGGDVPAVIAAAECLSVSLAAASRLAGAMGVSSVSLLPSLINALLTCGDWTLRSFPQPVDTTVVIRLRMSVLVGFTTLVQTLPGFVSEHVPRIVKMLLAPQLLGRLHAPAPFSRVDRRVGISMDGSPKLSLPGNADNTEHVGPRAVLPEQGEALLEYESLEDPSIATTLLDSLCSMLETRVVFPALLGAWPWVATTSVSQDKAGTSGVSGPAAPAILLRCITRVVCRLDRPAVRDTLIRLTPLLLSALDWRWMSTDPASVLAVLASTGTSDVRMSASELTRQAVIASVMETEAATLVTALALRLGDKALRPLLARLASWASAGEEDIIRSAETATAEAEAIGTRLPASSGATSAATGYWTFGRMCRRLVYFRVLTAVSSVARAALSPFITDALMHAAREVAFSLAVNDRVPPSSDATHHASGEKRKSASQSGGPSKRARGGNQEQQSTAQGEQHTDANDLEGLSLASSLSYSALRQLDGLWNPAALHEVPLPGPSSDDSLSAPSPSTVAACVGATASVVPSTPHSLRCMALGFLSCALAQDGASSTAPESSLFPARGVLGRERLDVILTAVSAGLRATRLSLRLHHSTSAAVLAEPHSVVVASGVPGGRDGWTVFIDAYVIPLTSALVSASRRDTLWKPLTQACLLAIRSDHPEVRLAALRCVATVYSAGGDDALVLLPETLSYLSEVLADGNPAVEAAASSLLARLENTAGEDLQKYLA